MGFAFWKGKIELVLPKYSYAPGDTITGKVNLKLKKQIKARGLTVRLLGEEITTRHVRRSDGRRRTRTSTVTLCDIEIPLDGEKEYKVGKYDFELPIPSDALDGPQEPDGAMGGVIKTLEFASGTRRRTKWTVIANLDIPKGIDVSNEQTIVLKKK